MDNFTINGVKKLSGQIKDFCKPLETFLGISSFHYYKVFNAEGDFINIATDDYIIEEYYSSVKSEVLFFKEYLEIQSKFKYILWPDQPSSIGMQVYFNRNYWHGLTIKTDNADSIELFCFLSKKNNPKSRDFWIGYSRLFEIFIKNFKSKFNDSVIKESKIYKAKYINGCSFEFPEQKIIHSIDQDSFLNAINFRDYYVNKEGRTFKITNKERQCWKLLSQGYTKKGIGKSLFISPKTVSNHIDNIKNKTETHCKDLLVDLYRDLFE